MTALRATAALLVLGLVAGTAACGDDAATATSGRETVHLLVIGDDLWVSGNRAFLEPYPLRLAGSAGTEGPGLEFLEYGKPLNLKPPPASKVIERI